MTQIILKDLKNEHYAAVTINILNRVRAPFSQVTLQSSADGRTNWKSFTRPITFDSSGVAFKRVDARTIGKKGSAMYIRALTYGQNSSSVSSPVNRER